MKYILSYACYFICIIAAYAISPYCIAQCDFPTYCDPISVSCQTNSCGDAAACPSFTGTCTGMMPICLLTLQPITRVCLKNDISTFISSGIPLDTVGDALYASFGYYESEACNFQGVGKFQFSTTPTFHFSSSSYGPSMEFHRDLKVFNGEIGLAGPNYDANQLGFYNTSFSGCASYEKCWLVEGVPGADLMENIAFSSKDGYLYAASTNHLLVGDSSAISGCSDSDYYYDRTAQDDTWDGFGLDIRDDLGYAFVTNPINYCTNPKFDTGLNIININGSSFHESSNPVVAHVDLNEPYAVKTKHNFAYVTDRSTSACSISGNLTIINNIESLNSGISIYSMTMMEQGQIFENLDLRECVAYTTSIGVSSEGKLAAYDISDPRPGHIKMLSNHALCNQGYHLAVSHDYPYIFVGEGIDGYGNQFGMEVFDISAVHAVVDLNSPLQGATEQEFASLLLAWEEKDPSLLINYDLYFWVDGDSEPSLPSQILVSNSFMLFGLNPSTTYHWKVAAHMAHCGDAQSDTYSIYTKSIDCDHGPVIVSKHVGTTAGGTILDIYSTCNECEADCFSSETSIGFDLANCGSPSDIYWSDPEDIKIDSTNSQHIRLKTPRMIEQVTGIAVDIDGDSSAEICLESGYEFRTLAYTANHNAHSASVIDTLQNEIFAETSDIKYNGTASPTNVAYNLTYPPGRVLYSLDSATGNMKYSDASNFIQLGDLQLQDPAYPPSSQYPEAFDIATDGYEGFVSHVTAGLSCGTSERYIIPGNLTWLNVDENGIPSVQSADNDCEQESPGAPEGITRAWLCAGDPPDCETAPDSNFYPLSIRIVTLASDVPDHVFQDNEPWPGSYAFVSGVGYSDGTTNRDAMVAVIDLNQYLYCDAMLHGVQYCSSQNHRPLINSRWWQTLQATECHANYKTTIIGSDSAAGLGQRKHAMDFAADSSAYLGTPPALQELGPTLYVANQNEDQLYLFQYSGGDWVPVMDGNDPFTIATGGNPTGVKVQKVTIQNVNYLYNYISNANDDTVTVVDTASNTELAFKSPIQQTACYSVTSQHLPMSIDARSSGDMGYSADATSGTVSVYDLRITEMFDIPYGCAIDVGSTSHPVDIIVQPKPEEDEIFQEMMGLMSLSSTNDYCDPSDQDSMIGDWKAIRRLVLTPASPTAINATINAILNKIDQKVTKEKLKKHLKKGVSLYQAAYNHNHRRR
jgi:hypothetical protein